jgi:uncharacterized protein (TIGR03437 family)
MIRTCSLRDWSLGVFVAALLGGHAVGQSIVVPNANATTAGGDTSGALPSVPFSIEFQNVVDPGQFGSVSGPIYITGFSFRAAPGTGPLNVTISGSVTLSTSPNYPSSAGGHTLLSTTFANNVGMDSMQVLSGNFAMSGPGCAAPGPCPFANTLEFTTPFLYNPKNGPLLVDVKATSFTVASGQFDVADCNAANCTYAGIDATPLGSSTAAKINESGTVAQLTYSTNVTVIPNGNANKIGGDTSGALPSAPTPFEFQQVFGTGQFPTGPIYITGFTWRPAPGTGPLSVTVNGNIYLSTSPNYPNTTGGHTLLSTTFANNVGPDNTLVASGNFTVSGAACAGPAPCPWASNITFSKPFFYDPASGALLIDIQATNFSGSSGQFDVVDCQAPGCGLASVYGTLGSATAVGFNYGNNVTLITYTTTPPVTPAPTTSFTYTANVSKLSTEAGNIVGVAPVAVTPFGNATGELTITVPVDQNENLTGAPYDATLAFFFNETDSFTVNGSLPSIKGGVAEAFSATVTGGTGAYAGASGSVSLTLTLGNGGTLAGNGSITVKQKTTAITLQSSFPSEGGAGEYFTSTITGHGIATVSSLGTASIRYTVNDSVLGDPTTLAQAMATFSFNANDGFSALFKFPANTSGPPANAQGIIVEGKGTFSGATGTATLTLTPTNSGNTISGSGSISVPAPSVPVITSVTTAFGPNVMSQNTWLQINGSNLVPATTPAGGVDWSNAPDFASGRMPVVLNGVSVKINNKPAYMYFFCSAVTAPICPVDQINVLAPLDTNLGVVTVVVTGPTGTTAPYRLRMETNSPSFLLFDTHGDIIARHLDATYSLLGPTTLPFAATPAKAGETIWLAGIGFGLPTTTLVDGSSTQLGALPVMPICFIGPNQAAVPNASVVGPGLYILTVTVPNGTPSGDNLVSCDYAGNALVNSSTPSGGVINVQ